jgi:transitional endoplasmic reticulum ATPase
LTVVDMAHLLTLADARPVDIMVDRPLPAPLRGLRVSLTTTGDRRELDAVVHYGRSRPQPYFRAVGNGPLGTLLKRRLDAGDERAVRIVAGLQSTADRLNRLSSGRVAPPRPRVVESAVHTENVVDAVTGLTTIARSPAAASMGVRTVRLHARGPTFTAAELAAFFDAIVQLMRRVAGVEVTGEFVMAAEQARPDRVSLDQVGGLDDVVAAFRDIAVSFRHPACMARWGAHRLDRSSQPPTCCACCDGSQNRPRTCRPAGYPPSSRYRRG